MINHHFSKGRFLKIKNNRRVSLIYLNLQVCSIGTSLDLVVTVGVIAVIAQSMPHPAGDLGPAAAAGAARAPPVFYKR
jgi:hypothetical protein